MAEPTQPIRVAGFLGAGKSRLVAALAEAGIAAVEHDPLTAPAGPARVLTVVDAANLPACLDDAVFADLVRAQIAVAALVVVARADVTPPGPARAALAGLTRAAIRDAHDGRLDLSGLEVLPPGPPGPGLDAADRFARWSYRGPVSMRAQTAEALAANRPPGTWRLTGTIRTGDDGLEIEVAGQVRQTRKLAAAAAAETVLTAIGPRDRFRPRAMDVAFAEAAAEGAFRGGMFGHR